MPGMPPAAVRAAFEAKEPIQMRRVRFINAFEVHATLGRRKRKQDVSLRTKSTREMLGGNQNGRLNAYRRHVRV